MPLLKDKEHIQYRLLVFLKIILELVELANYNFYGVDEI